MGKSKIEWTEFSWNPVVGCTKVSAGCKHCFAERMARRLRAMGAPQYQDVVDKNGWTGKIHIVESAIDKPLHWKKPRMIFVCSMSDLFHDEVDALFIADIFKTMKNAPQHTFQVLTKGPWRMYNLLSRLRWWPLSNVWLGVTAENQIYADERIPFLLKIPARVRFVSAEPLLGPIDLSRYMPSQEMVPVGSGPNVQGAETEYYSGIAWCIVGGESGPNARPMHPNWARLLRDQCTNAGVPYFFKQFGAWSPDCRFAGRGLSTIGLGWEGVDFINMRRVGRKAAGRLLDGREWNEYPGK